MCSVELASMIPISLAGIGLPQVAFVGLLAAFKVSPARSLASHIVSWIPWLPIYLCGAGLMLRESLARPDLPFQHGDAESTEEHGEINKTLKR
jgi:hypothetical protein